MSAPVLFVKVCRYASAVIACALVGASVAALPACGGEGAGSASSSRGQASDGEFSRLDVESAFRQRGLPLIASVEFPSSTPLQVVLTGKRDASGPDDDYEVVLFRTTEGATRELSRIDELLKSLPKTRGERLSLQRRNVVVLYSRETSGAVLTQLREALDGLDE